MTPKISVIVPVYNVEKYLDRCMRSLLSQTFRDLEIILVDDGSTDNCPAMCNQYALQNTNIKVIHKMNGGLGYARNSGLDVATGDFVAFVDSDDYVDVSMYEKLYNAAVATGADATYCQFLKENSKGEMREIQEIEDDIITFSGENVGSFLLDMVASSPEDVRERVYQMCVWRAIYRRSLIEDHNIRFQTEREILSEDIVFHADFLLKAKEVAFIPDHLYCYCYNQTSLTKKFDVKKFDRSRALYCVMTQKLRDIPNSICRVDKFYFGYIRSLIRSLMQSSIAGKRALIRAVCKDFNDIDIASRYPVKKCRLDCRLFFRAMAGNRVFAIMVLCIVKDKLPQIN